MRLIDEIRDAIKSKQYRCSPGYLDFLQNYLEDIDIPDLPIIDISNVADYVVGNRLTIHGPLSEFFVGALPPFFDCWMEFQHPDENSTVIGAMVYVTDLRTCSVEEKNKIVWGGKGTEPTHTELLQKFAWIVEAIFSVRHGDCIDIGVDALYALLDSNGAWLRVFEGEDLDPEWTNHRSKAQGITLEEQKRRARNMLLVIAMASAFMSCKNVQLVENQAPRYERRQRERKKKPPLTKFYTLNIEPMKKILRTEGRSEEVGLKKALHICRGHFAHYTPDKPLFGKIAGCFWIPAHVRGSKESGEIKKDYKVILND